MAKCFVCSNEKTKGSYYPKLAFNNKIFEFRKCTQCGLAYLIPSLSEEDVSRLYDIDYHEAYYFKSDVAIDRRYGHKAEILKQQKKEGSLLDYGCGDASFLKSLQGADYKLYGAEYNPALVDKLKIETPGIEFFSISEIMNNKVRKFDIIHLSDVMGQVADPRAMIEMLRERLSPGGVLYIESPVEHNFHVSLLFRAAYYRLRKGMNPGRVVPGKPFRVMFSTRRNQELFFKNAGYKTLHYEIFEWAWPFPDHWQDARSARQKIEFVIGSISKFFARRIGTWGNRFYYIGTPQKEQGKGD